MLQTQNSASKVMASVFSDSDGICWLIKSKRVQQPQKATTHLSWTKWSRYWSPNSRESCQKECCFSRTMPPHTWLPSDYHLFPNFNNIWTGWNFLPLRIPYLLQVTSLQPKLQHSIWTKYLCQTIHYLYYKPKDLTASCHIPWLILSMDEFVWNFSWLLTMKYINESIYIITAFDTIVFNLLATDFFF